MVRQVVGVGSVGMRVYLLLLEGRSGADPLFLQVKQAGPSVYEEHLRPSPHDNHGERVISGKRLVQAATDIFVGWGSLHGRDYYVRQFRDMKIIPTTELIAPRLAEFATACGETLARAHARTGDPVAISGYIGKGKRFAAAVAGSPAATPTRTSATTPSWSPPSPRRPSTPSRADRAILRYLSRLSDLAGGVTPDRGREGADGAGADLAVLRGHHRRWRRCACCRTPTRTSRSPWPG